MRNAVLGAGHFHPVDHDLAAVGNMRSGHHLHERRFSGAVATNDCNHFTALKIEGTVAQGLDASERFRNVFDRKERLLSHG